MPYDPWLAPTTLEPARRRKGGRPRTSLNPKGTTARGYDGQHRRARAIVAVQVAAGLARCCYCRQPIRPGSRWHLSHGDRADAHALHLYAGPAHAKCNNATNKRRQAPAKPAKALEFFGTKKPAPQQIQLTVL